MVTLPWNRSRARLTVNEIVSISEYDPITNEPHRYELRGTAKVYIDNKFMSESNLQMVLRTNPQRFRLWLEALGYEASAAWSDEDLAIHGKIVIH